MNGSDLKAFRISHRLTQGRVAQRLQISRGAIIDYEQDRRPIPTWLGLAIAAWAAGLHTYSASPEDLQQVLRKRRVDGPALAAGLRH